MEVSPTGPGTAPVIPNSNDPLDLLRILINLQVENNNLQRQMLDLQRQQLELAREATQVSREQRQRQASELERWQNSHDGVLENCKEALGQLEQVHSALMRDLAEYVDENHDNLMDGDFALSDFVDRFGPRLAHLNTMLAILRPLSTPLKKPEGQA
jgi:DNA repair photolyase